MFSQLLQVFRTRNPMTKMTNLSKSTILRMERSGDFPASFSVGSRAVAFDRKEVEEWIQQRKEKGQASRV